MVLEKWMFENRYLESAFRPIVEQVWNARNDEIKDLIESRNKALSDLDNLQKEFTNCKSSLQELQREMMIVLKGLKRGDCFCEMSIGNPMVKDHTESCKRAMMFFTAITYGKITGVRGLK
jgi:hypothetical protein